MAKYFCQHSKSIEHDKKGERGQNIFELADGLGINFLNELSYLQMQQLCQFIN